MSYTVLSGFLVSTIMPIDSLQSTIVLSDIVPITILLSCILLSGILINVIAPIQLVLDLSGDVFRLNQFPFNFGNLLKLKIPLKPD
jgi:hypothetical protein